MQALFRLIFGESLLLSSGKSGKINVCSESFWFSQLFLMFLKQRENRFERAGVGEQKAGLGCRERREAGSGSAHLFYNKIGYRREGLHRP
jgi:hypothetical protein